MRRLGVLLLILLTTTSFAAARLSRELARKRISELSSSKLLLGAIEVREITQDSPNRATVESTITLAFQFKKTDQGAWAVDAIRFGDRDWVNMSELLAAIYHGNLPGASAPPSITNVRPITPIEAFHVNQNQFERERARMVELGASPLIPGAIEIRRVIAQNEVRTIAESTVTMGFRFVRSRSNEWTIEAARLGDRDWINTVDLIATLNEGRRRETQAMMENLAAAIEKYRKEKGFLPQARNITELTDILHPDYISGLFRVDGWGQEIEYSASASTFRLRSKGPDGRLFTADDIVVNPSPTPSP
jgi:hypothetical protein